MEWKKAKTILIWLFIVIDVCLLAYNIYSNYGNNKVDFDSLLPVLNANNIKISDTVSVKNKKYAFVYEYKKSQITEELKTTLLGDYDEIYDGRYTSKDKKSILKTDGNEFFYENKSPHFKDFSDLNEKNSEKILKKYFKLLGIDEFAQIKAVTKNDDKYTASCIFKIGELEIFSSNLTFIISTNGIHKIYGTLNIPDVKNGYNFELSNIETILLNFSRNEQNNSKNKKITVEEIKLGCYLSDYENAVTSQALPAYMIKTKDKIYIYDAREGVDFSNRQLAIK